MFHSKLLPSNQHLIELFFIVITVTQWPCGDHCQCFITGDEWSLGDRFDPETPLSVVLIIIILITNSF